MEKIKSTYYPSRGRMFPYEYTFEENNQPPKPMGIIQHLSEEETIQHGIEISRQWKPTFVIVNPCDMPDMRAKKMRKVIAHLNRKPFFQKHFKSIDHFLYLLIGAGVSYFVVRFLWWFITTNKFTLI